MTHKKDSVTALDEAQVLLQEARGLLDDIPAMSHAGFSNITEHMGNFSGSFATAATRATSIRERIQSDGELGLKPLRSDMRKVYREISGIFKALDGLVGKMGTFVDQMHLLIDWGLAIEERTFLPPIVTQIKATSGEGLEIQTMGAIIDSLIQQTRPLVQEIISATQEASDVVNNLSRRTVADLASSEHGLSALRDNTTQAMALLGKAVKSINRSCVAMDKRSGKVNAVVFEMVQAMQFDDITAQRVAHALDALDKAAVRLDGMADDPDTPTWVSIVSNITLGQMGDTRDDLNGAIENARKQLGQITNLAREQVEAIGEVRATSVDFRQYTGDISYHLSSLRQLGIFNRDLANEVLRTLSRAESAVFQAKRAMNVLSLTVGRLDQLASSLQTQGSERLKILTRNILTLTSTIQREAPDRVAELTQAASLLQSISLAFSDKATPKMVRTDSLLRRAPLSTKQLEINNNDLMAEMNASLGDAQATAIQIMLLAEELAFHHTISGRVDDCSGKLAAMLKAIDAPSAAELGDDIMDKADAFEDISSMYTMDSERRIHNATLDVDGDADGGGDDGIELF